MSSVKAIFLSRSYHGHVRHTRCWCMFVVMKLFTFNFYLTGWFITIQWLETSLSDKSVAPSDTLRTVNFIVCLYSVLTLSCFSLSELVRCWKSCPDVPRQHTIREQYASRDRSDAVRFCARAKWSVQYGFFKSRHMFREPRYDRGSIRLWLYTI